MARQIGSKLFLGTGMPQQRLRKAETNCIPNNGTYLNRFFWLTENQVIAVLKNTEVSLALKIAQTHLTVRHNRRRVSQCGTVEPKSEPITTVK